MMHPTFEFSHPGRPGIDPLLAFDRLVNRYRITAALEAVSGLRVGAGKSLDAAATDQPVIRDALGRPFIPGSSIKGTLRSSLESILRSLDRRDLHACNIFEQRCVGDSDDDQKLMDQGQTVPFDDVLMRTCTACSLFGSTFVAGRVFLHDLPCIKTGTVTEVRDGVGINRDLGTAQIGVKYDVEVVPVGTSFQLEILIENVYSYQLALILRCLALLHCGDILLGGLTSRGLGKVKLVEPKLESTNGSRLLAGEDFETLDFQQATEAAGELLTKLLTEGEG